MLLLLLRRCLVGFVGVLVVALWLETIVIVIMIVVVVMFMVVIGAMIVVVISEIRVVIG